MNRSVQRGASYLTPDTTFTVLQAFHNKAKLEIKSQLYFLKCYDYFLRHEYFCACFESYIAPILGSLGIMVTTQTTFFFCMKWRDLFTQQKSYYFILQNKLASQSFLRNSRLRAYKLLKFLLINNLKTTLWPLVIVLFLKKCPQEITKSVRENSPT